MGTGEEVTIVAEDQDLDLGDQDQDLIVEVDKEELAAGTTIKGDKAQVMTEKEATVKAAEAEVVETT